MKSNTGTESEHITREEILRELESIKADISTIQNTYFEIIGQVKEAETAAVTARKRHDQAIDNGDRAERDAALDEIGAAKERESELREKLEQLRGASGVQNLRRRKDELRAAANKLLSKAQMEEKAAFNNRVEAQGLCENASHTLGSLINTLADNLKNN